LFYVLCVLAEGAATHSAISTGQSFSLPFLFLDHLQVEVVLVVEKDVATRGLSGRLNGCVKGVVLE
jgi:hypothetical protein